MNVILQSDLKSNPCFPTFRVWGAPTAKYEQKAPYLVKASFCGLLGLIFRNYLIFQELKIFGTYF